MNQANNKPTTPYVITKRQSEHPNEWDLYIGEACVGSVEVLFLTATSRTCFGSVSAMTKDSKLVEYKFDGGSTRKIMSIANFIKNAAEVLAPHDLILNVAEAEEEREFDNIILIKDVNEENVHRVATHLGVQVAGDTAREVLDNITAYLAAERDKMLANPMYELVRRSKFKKVLVTPDVF